MLQWVWEAAVRSDVSDRVLVATPDEEILVACQRFGADAILTSLDHPSGTDRIAEVAKKVGADIFINVQGDEPLVAVKSIEACASAFRLDANVVMSSLYCDCPTEDVDNPNVVKVVTDRAGDALYFSRYAVPFPRNERVVPVKKHIGIYGYSREVLGKFTEWSQGELERTESLEQLRFLENGVKIRMVLGEESGTAVDTPEQAELVRQYLFELK